MPVIDITKDTDQHKITITAEFAAPPERVWQVYADPRQLEKVWGPPGYPATVVLHEFVPGGRMHYFMTSPEGEKFPGYWQFSAVDAPSSFEFSDGFADMDFRQDENLPESQNHYAFTAAEGGTRAVYTSVYPSAEALQQVVDMGVEEGTRQAFNQIDDLLAAD